MLSLLSAIPNIAKALTGGGSIGDKALNALKAFFGLDVSAEKSEVEKMLQVMTPEQLIRLKELDSNFATLVEKNKHELAMADTELSKSMLDIVKTDALSEDKIQRRWRPVLAWICVGAFGFAFIVMPIIVSLLAFSVLFLGVAPETASQAKSLMPVLDMASILGLLGYLLGYGGYRTFEKIKGANSPSVEPIPTPEPKKIHITDSQGLFMDYTVK